MGRGRCLPELEDEKSFYRARWVPFLDGQDQVRFRQLVAAMPGVALAFTKMWSLMEFLNPGWLGSRESYRRRFLLPIQQQQEKRTMEQLKLLTGPFILRRIKTDKAIIADLPEKFETKVFCYLTREQASLYKAVTDEMLELIDQEDPMSRRGLVLATLTKLKQICNHPALFLQDGSRIQGRSGKLIRFTEILEEMLASDQRALVFTQYARMGHMLKTYLEDVFNQEVLFLHGQVPKGKRDAMIQRFQQDPEAPGIFILSLRAGGTGLNLTRASHVFHYDRWWNPAVENQATDRAFCIGQTRNVQVHKLLCVGTLEERIDALIEGEADPCSADSGGRGTGLDGTFHRGIAGTYPVAGKVLRRIVIGVVVWQAEAKATELPWWKLWPSLGLSPRVDGGLLVIIGGQGGGNRLLLPTAPTPVSVVEKAMPVVDRCRVCRLNGARYQLRCKVPGGLPINVCWKWRPFLGRRRRLLWRFCGKLPRWWQTCCPGSFRRIWRQCF